MFTSGYIFFKELLNRWRGGGGSHVFVWVFVKGHALKHSRKWKGHDCFLQKNSKIPRPTPPNKKRTFPYNDLQPIVLIWGKIAIIFSSDYTLPWVLLIYSWMWSQQTHAKIGDSVNWRVTYHRPGTLVHVKSISSFRHHNVLIKVPSSLRAYPGNLTSWHNSTWGGGGGGFDNSSWIWQSL